MKRNGKGIAALLVIAMLIACLSGCNKTGDNATSTTTNNEASSEATAATNEIKTFTAFMAVPGTEIPEDNRMLNVIAEKTGAKADVTWLTGQTAAERVGVMVAGGEYPDLIDGSDGTEALIGAGALVPLDEHLDKYPNIKNYYTEEQWNQIRREDGHIYYIPQFGNVHIENMEVEHFDQAFWIQKRVLEWADYPEVKTLDQYFDLIQNYLAANPEDEDGQTNIGFEILSDDWRYFVLENPPQFLDGYPNDGCAIVDTATKKAKVYDTTDTAKMYFNKLSEMYDAGVIDPETFTMNYDQYIAKISSGRVIGLVDAGWQFTDARNSLISQGKFDRGYVPLGIVKDENTVDQYRTPPALNTANGLGVTVSCDDVDGALQLINDLLDPEVITMRMWGEEGVDYDVDDDGMYFRTDEQRANTENTDWMELNFANTVYSYFPNYVGTMDGKNAIDPKEQVSEFQLLLKDIDKRILEAYGHERWTNFLTQGEANSEWFPLWSATNAWTTDTEYGVANQKMDDIKQEWIPKVIMTPASDFEQIWEEYMQVYNDNVDVKAYEDELTAEIARRIAVAEGK